MEKRIAKVIMLVLSVFLLSGFSLGGFKEKKVESNVINPIYRIIGEQKAAKAGITRHSTAITVATAKKILAGDAPTFPSTFTLNDYDGDGEEDNDDYLPEVKNRGSLKISGAFAFTNAIETNMLMNNNVEVNFSEDYYEYLNHYYTESFANNGEETYYSFANLVYENHGPITETLFGSYSTTYSAKTVAELFDRSRFEYDITDYEEYPYADFDLEEDSFEDITSVVEAFNLNIKHHLTNNGSVISYIIADSSCYNTEYNVYYCSEYPESSNEIRYVSIVGWNDSYFDVNNDGVKEGAWLIQNDQGSTNEYFYVSYYDPIITYSAEGVVNVKSSDYKHLYTYDEISNDDNSIGKETIDFYKNTTYTETIKAIKLRSSNTYSLTVNVYDSTNEDGDLEFNSTPDCSKTVYSITPGVNYIEFTSCQISGEQFRVELVSIDGEDHYSDITIETTDSETSPASVVSILSPQYISSQLQNLGGKYMPIQMIMRYVTPGTTHTLQIFDDSETDITSNFEIEYGDITNMYVNDYITLKNSLTNTEHIVVKATVNSISDSETFTLISIDLSGIGTEEDPYLIKKPSDFRYLDSGTGYYKLNNSIDMEFDTSYSGGQFYDEYEDSDLVWNWSEAIYFSGTFDGNGYTIYNLNSNYDALFENITNATVKNLKLVNANTHNGSIAMESYDSTITNCEVTDSTIRGYSAGGLVGSISGGTYTNNRIVKNTIIGEDNSGILAGFITNSGNFGFGKSGTVIENNLLSNNTIYTEKSDEDGEYYSGAIVGQIDYYRDKSLAEPRDVYGTITINENYIGLLVHDEDENKVFPEYLNGLLNYTIYDSSNPTYTPTEDDIDIIVERNVGLNGENYGLESTYSALDLISIWAFYEGELPVLRIFEVDPSLPAAEIYFDNTLITNNILFIDENYEITEFLGFVTAKEGVTLQKLSLENEELTPLDSVVTGIRLRAINNKEIKTVGVVVAGDSTGDGIVNIADVVKTADVSLLDDYGTIIKNPYQLKAMDVTYSDGINIADVKRIADHSIDNSISLLKENDK